ncbi:MAG: hypothetical protein V4466_04030 [Pseudomonadota bacterium]
MYRTTTLLGAVAALALGGVAAAQVVGGAGGAVGATVGGVAGQVGASGQVISPDLPTERAADAVGDTTDAGKAAARRAQDRANDAVDSASDASANAAASASLSPGTSVRDRNGAEIGTVAGVDASGNARIKTSTGVITVPSTVLTVSGGIAVSNMSEAQMRASASTKTQ